MRPVWKACPSARPGKTACRPVGNKQDSDQHTSEGELVDCPKDRLTMSTSCRGVACYALDPSTLKVSLGQSTNGTQARYVRGDYWWEGDFATSIRKQARFDACHFPAPVGNGRT